MKNMTAFAATAIVSIVRILQMAVIVAKNGREKLMINKHELENMIFKYNSRKNLHTITLSNGAINEIIGVLQELKQRRESDLRPATRFVSSTIGQQLTKIQQEFKEVEAELAYEYFNKESAAEELIDLQTACETMLVILGLDEQQRMDARRQVIRKNMERGYYE